MLADEAFEGTARRIREVVLARTGISVSAGGGTRRIIAKLATGLAKPAGVCVVPAGEEAEFMRRFDLEDIPGIGPAFLGELQRRSLRSVNDVLRVQPEWLERWFGARRARLVARPGAGPGRRGRPLPPGAEVRKRGAHLRQRHLRRRRAGCGTLPAGELGRAARPANSAWGRAP